MFDLIEIGETIFYYEKKSSEHLLISVEAKDNLRNFYYYII